MLKVTIVTVVYNGAATLERTILSVLNQTYPAIEYIIIDGGSTDGSVDIIKKYQDRLAYWQSGKDGGIYFAMNIGLSKATGTLINFKNADDWFLPIAVEIVVSKFTEHQADITYGNTFKVWQINPLKTSLLVSDDNQLIKRSCVDHRSAFFLTQMHKLKPYNTAYKLAADYDFMLWAKVNAMKFSHIGETLGYMQQGGASNNSTVFAEVFKIQRLHLGLGTAVTNYVISLFTRVNSNIKNKILMSILGKTRFMAFKGRNTF